MWEEIEKKGHRYQELKNFIESPDGPGNPQYAAWLREFGRLARFGELWTQYADAEKSFREADSIIKESTDADLKALAEEEVGPAKQKMDEARRALIDMALNEDEDAARALKQAVKLNPEDTEYQTELGSILVKLAQYREAISPLKKALELDPENSRAMNLLDDAEAGRKRIDFVPVNKDANRSTNSNANGAASNTATSPQTSTNTSRPSDTKNPPTPPRPAPTKSN